MDAGGLLPRGSQSKSSWSQWDYPSGKSPSVRDSVGASSASSNSSAQFGASPGQDRRRAGLPQEREGQALGRPCHEALSQHPTQQLSAGHGTLPSITSRVQGAGERDQTTSGVLTATAPLKPL